MGGLLYLAGTLVFVPTFIYTFKRKMRLNTHYWDSIGVAIRDWSKDAALDAKAAVDEEFLWTIAMIVSMIPAVAFPFYLVLWLLGNPRA